MKVEVIPEKDFAGTVADELVTAIGEVLEERDRCAVCLSGGTTPAAIYRLLGLPPRVREIPWDRVVFFWGDERFVPQDDSRSNARMVRDTLLHQLRDGATPAIYPIDTTLASAEASAAAYEETIRGAGYLNPESAERSFDIVLLGVGEDGHIASIFPGHSVPEDRIAFACHHPSDGTERVSLTPRALFSADRVYFLVKGASKEQIMSRLLSAEELSTQELPAAYARSARGEVLWFLDREAAGVL